MKTVKLTTTDLENLVKKILKEEERPRGGVLYSDSVKNEVIQEVIDRMTQYSRDIKIFGDSEAEETYKNYLNELKELNNRYPLKRN